MVCPTCDTTVRPGSAFCAFCGEALPKRKWYKRPMFWWYSSASFVLAAGLLCFAFFATQGNALIQREFVSIANAAQPASLSLKDVVNASLPSVVEVDATAPDGDDLGSGFVYDAQGDVLTNAHVVTGATAITVKTRDGKSHDATLIGLDDAKDLALLRVPTLTDISPLRLGDSDKVELGDAVIAIGNPLGLSDTVTTGIVSGLHRNLTIEKTNYKDLFQISAPIAPGNSGGPLIAAGSGQVIGINAAGSTSSGSIGFSIPINQAKALASEWAEKPLVQGAGAAASEWVNVLTQYYKKIVDGDYDGAYNMLSARYQEKLPFPDWMNFAGTFVDANVTDPVVINSSSTSAEVTCSLTGMLRQSDGSVRMQVYHLDFMLVKEDGNLYIDQATGKLLTE